MKKSEPRQHSTTSPGQVSFLKPITPLSGPYVYYMLTPLYCDYSLSSLLEYDSHGGKTYVCVPEILAPCSLRSRRNIKQMFPQLNSTVKLYPSFSQLFTFM